MSSPRIRSLLAALALALGVVACTGGDRLPIDEQRPDTDVTEPAPNPGQEPATDDLQEGDVEQAPHIDGDS